MTPLSILLEIVEILQLNELAYEHLNRPFNHNLLTLILVIPKRHVN